MLAALNEIATGFNTPDQIRESSYTELGLDFEEALEMAYENLQETAREAIKGILPIMEA